MRGLIGLVLVLVGGGVMLFGIVRGVVPLVRMYQDALQKPLDDRPADATLQGDMLRGVLIGACGVPVFLVGMVMTKAALYRKLRRLGERR